MRLLRGFLGLLATALGAGLGAVMAIFAVLFGPKDLLDGIIVDRSKWAVGDGSEVSPEEAIRPIQAVLLWLQHDDLLTVEGQHTLSAIESDGETDVALVKELMTSEAWEFISTNYDTWYQTSGVNYAVDKTLEINHDTQLDELWESFNETGKSVSPQSISLRVILCLRRVHRHHNLKTPTA